MTARHSARAVRSRRHRRCLSNSRHQIRPGDLYVRTVIFAGHDAHPGPGHPPRTGALCSVCAENYADTSGLIAARLESGRDVPTREGVPDYLSRLHQLHYYDPGAEPWLFWGLAPAESLWGVPEPAEGHEFIWLHRTSNGVQTFCKALINLDTGLIVRRRPGGPEKARRAS